MAQTGRIYTVKHCVNPVKHCDTYLVESITKNKNVGLWLRRFLMFLLIPFFRLYVVLWDKNRRFKV